MPRVTASAAPEDDPGGDKDKSTPDKMGEAIAAGGHAIAIGRAATSSCGDTVAIGTSSDARAPGVVAIGSCAGWESKMSEHRGMRPWQFHTFFTAPYFSVIAGVLTAVFFWPSIAAWASKNGGWSEETLLNLHFIAWLIPLSVWVLAGALILPLGYSESVDNRKIAKQPRPKNKDLKALEDKINNYRSFTREYIDRTYGYSISDSVIRLQSNKEEINSLKEELASIKERSPQHPGSKERPNSSAALGLHDYVEYNNRAHLVQQMHGDTVEIYNIVTMKSYTVSLQSITRLTHDDGYDVLEGIVLKGAFQNTPSDVAMVGNIRRL